MDKFLSNPFKSPWACNCAMAPNPSTHPSHDELRGWAQRNDPPPDLVVFLERIPLSKDGYTRSGRYFGTGPALFEAVRDDNGRIIYFRAKDKTAAKRLVKEYLPMARFQ